MPRGSEETHPEAEFRISGDVQVVSNIEGNKGEREAKAGDRKKLRHRNEHEIAFPVERLVSVSFHACTRKPLPCTVKSSR